MDSMDNRGIGILEFSSTWSTHCATTSIKSFKTNKHLASLGINTWKKYTIFHTWYVVFVCHPAISKSIQSVHSVKVCPVFCWEFGPVCNICWKQFWEKDDFSNWLNMENMQYITITVATHIIVIHRKCNFTYFTPHYMWMRLWHLPLTDMMDFQSSFFSTGTGTGMREYCCGRG